MLVCANVSVCACVLTPKWTEGSAAPPQRAACQRLYGGVISFIIYCNSAVGEIIIAARPGGVAVTSIP